jgi:hypothetical protein
VRQDRHGRVVVRYLIRDPHGVVKRQWILWEGGNGSWRIVYDPFLNFALAVDAQRSAQERMDLSARKLSHEARRAGRRAARLQPEYLKQAQRER